MPPAPMRVVGRYAIYDELGRGGMAAVHFGRLFGEAGFSRVVAVKMLRPELALDPAFVAMFVDEARLCARVSHVNVVQTLDVVATQGELFVVMEYVHGESLARLIRRSSAACRGRPSTPSASGHAIPPEIAVAIVAGALFGLHAAHEAKSPRGEPLDIVHRDVSPDNILVGVDGVAKVADFGVAKARGRHQKTRTGELKGKLAYMAPEQLEGRATRLTDVFAASVVLWEALAGRRLFEGSEAAIAARKMHDTHIDSPRTFAPEVPQALEQAVMRGLARRPEERFASAFEMATALEGAVTPAGAMEVAAWVAEAAKEGLAERAATLQSIEHPVEERPASERSPAPPPESESETDAGEPTRAVPGLALAAAAPAEHVDRSRRPPWIAGALLAFALCGGALVFRRVRAPENFSVPTQPAATAIEIAREPAPVLDTPVDAGPSPPPPATASIKSKPRPVRSREPACSPPYSIGSDGLRHYKPECW